jgi:hypothetical protein
MALPEVRPGYWLELPNTKMRAAARNPLPPATSGYGILTESSGLIDTKRRLFAFNGGGHADYAGNEWMAFSLDTLTWSILWPGTPIEQIPTAPGNYITYPDGNPSSRHTRDGLEYLPETDEYFLHGGSVWSAGGNARDTWAFNPNTKTWLALARPTNDTEFTNVYGAYDPNTKTMLIVRPLSLATKTLLYRYNRATNVWTLLNTSAYVQHRRTAAFDPRRNKLVLVGLGQIVYWNLNNPSAPAVVAHAGLSGTLARVGWGIEYDSDLDCYVVWAQGPQVYYIDPETFAITPHELPADSPRAPDTRGGGNIGPHGRFRRLAEGVYIAVNHVDDNVWLFRPKVKGDAMAKNVIVTVSSTQADFPEGTVGGAWRIKLIDGPDPRSVDGGNKTVTFNGVGIGTYRASAQRLNATGTPLGPEVMSEPFNVAADVVIKIDVAQGVTVQVIQG